jgi:hypothetical protein
MSRISYISEGSGDLYLVIVPGSYMPSDSGATVGVLSGSFSRKICPKQWVMSTQYCQIDTSLHSHRRHSISDLITRLRAAGWKARELRVAKFTLVASRHVHMQLWFSYRMNFFRGILPPPKCPHFKSRSLKGRKRQSRNSRLTCNFQRD